jgi:AcrR family transcriptional regulator
MPPPSAAPRRSIGAQRHPATEAAVVAAARDILAERGYPGFSIDEVARRAGAGKPTIYRWWPTRADLLLAVYERERTARLLPPDTGSLAGDLAALMRAILSAWRETPAGHALRGLVAEAQSGDAALLVLWDKLAPAFAAPVRAIFAEGARRGEIDPADTDLLVELLSGLLWRRLLTGQIDDDRTAIERAARLLATGRGRK